LFYQTKGIFKGFALELIFAYFCLMTKVGRAGARNTPLMAPNFPIAKKSADIMSTLFHVSHHFCQDMRLTKIH